MTALLEVEDLVVGRGGVPLLSGLALRVMPGEALLLTGPNGCGKSTLLRTLAGLLPPLAGSIRGEEPALAGHLDGVKAQLTVAENLSFWARVHGTGRAGPGRVGSGRVGSGEGGAQAGSAGQDEGDQGRSGDGGPGDGRAAVGSAAVGSAAVGSAAVGSAGEDSASEGSAGEGRAALGRADGSGPGESTADELAREAADPIAPALAQFALGPLRERMARNLSAGQKRRLGLARLMLTGRRLWLLDEPTVSLDAASVAAFGAMIGAHLAEGGAAVVATHVAPGFAARELAVAGFAAPAAVRAEADTFGAGW